MFSMLVFYSANAQEKSQTKEQEKKPPTVTQTGEIKLEDLHLEALIEKPSVSIVPKRIEPDLTGLTL